jgi:hypothetical protein
VFGNIKNQSAENAANWATGNGDTNHPLLGPDSRARHVHMTLEEYQAHRASGGYDGDPPSPAFVSA